MLSRPVKPKWMFRPMTAIATAAVCGERASRIMPLRMNWMVSMVVSPPSSDPLRLAEQTLRSHEQEQDQDQQRGRVLEVTGHAEHRRQLDDEADDQRTQQGAERRTEAAERHRSEEQQQDLQAGVPLDAVGDQRVE